VQSYEDNYMNITSAQFQKNEENETDSIKATIDGTVWSVPIDPANTDYMAIQEWVKEGNKIEDAD
jgi:hypothetical protein